MTAAIALKGLTKKFGSYAAVDSLDLEVKTGSVFGFLGPNGAGKTTTLRVLMGLAKATAGEAFILGRNVGAGFNEISRKVGYLPEVPAFYGWMRAAEYLRFCGQLFQMSPNALEERIDYLLKEAGLSGVAKPIAAYSRGMKQRLGIAQALINEPEVLFLDEPTSALDPIGRREILDLIDSFSKERTVFLSTHILSDVERVCDEVAIINQGKLITQASLEELKRRYITPVFHIVFDEPPGRFREALAADWIVEVLQDNNFLTIKVSDMPLAERELPKLIAEAGLKLRHFQIAEASLEDIFMKVVGGDV